MLSIRGRREDDWWEKLVPGLSFGLTVEGPRGVSLHSNSDLRLGELRQLSHESLSPRVGLGPSDLLTSSFCLLHLVLCGAA